MSRRDAADLRHTGVAGGAAIAMAGPTGSRNAAGSRWGLLCWVAAGPPQGAYN